MKLYGSIIMIDVNVNKIEYIYDNSIVFVISINIRK